MSESHESDQETKENLDVSTRRALTLLLVILAKRTLRLKILMEAADSGRWSTASYDLIVETIEFLLPTARSVLTHVVKHGTIPNGLTRLMNEYPNELGIVSDVARRAGLLSSDENNLVSEEVTEMNRWRVDYIRDRCEKMPLS